MIPFTNSDTIDVRENKSLATQAELTAIQGVAGKQWCESVMNENCTAWVDWQPDTQGCQCGGQWSHQTVASASQQLQRILSEASHSLTLDFSAITHCDASGGIVLAKFIQQLGQQFNKKFEVKLNEEQQHLFALINQHLPELDYKTTKVKPSVLYRLGVVAAKKMHALTTFFAFIGELAARVLTVFMRPSLLRMRYITHLLQQNGVNALPLVAFLSFLIGMVLTYQMGLQLRLYGANVFVVDLLGLSVLREFGPLITAILVAGRSGSAFTAQIGTMVVRQEIDAMRTMGLRPFDFLVLPRMVTLMIALPLLTVWANCFAIFGGMVMAQSMLDISFYEFLYRIRSEISLETYVVGMSKAPIFGLIIASVGCFQGFNVNSSAASVGQQTTKSVVQSLFLIIIFDAIFSVVFSINGF